MAAASSDQRSLAGSVLTLFTGTLFAQAIPFLAAPLIARLYDAPQFALYGAMLAVFNVLAVIAAGRYEMAIAVPQEEATAADLVKGAMLLSVVSGLAGYGLLWLLHGAIERHTGFPLLEPVIGMLGLLTVLAGSQLALQQWLLRKRAFKEIAAVKVLQAVATTVLVVLAGWYGVRGGLLLSYLIGWVLFTTATVLFAARQRVFAGGFAPGRTLDTLRDFRRYPLYNAAPAILNAAASGVAAIYMTLFFDPEVAGQHNFTRQYLLVPMSMTTVALGQALYERVASRVRENGPVQEELMVLLRWLLLAALGIALLITFAGPVLFRFFFGEEWAYAGNAARLLVWGYAAQLVSSPLGMLLFAMGRVKAAMVFPLILAGLMLIPMAFHQLAPMHFMALLAAIEVVAYSANVLLVLYHVRSYERARIA